MPTDNKIGQATPEAVARGTAAPSNLLNTPGLSTYNQTVPPPSLNVPAPSLSGVTPPPVITADTLKGTPTPMKLTTPPPPTTAPQVISTAGAIAQQEQAKSAEQQAYEASKAEMGGLVEQIGGKTAESLALAESTGLNKINQQISQNNAEILALQNATNQEKERLTKVPGMTQAGLQGLYNDLDNRNAFKITNLQMANAFASINAQGLQKTIETQLALKYEPLETKLAIAKLNYEDNKDFFTKSEQRQYETKVREEERKIAKEKADDENKFALLTKAMENGVQIPANLLSQINDPKTDSKKAASILAGAGISLENKLDVAYKQAQIAKMYQDIAESQNKIAPQNATPAQSGAQLQFLKDTVSKAKQLAGASGRSGARRFVEGALVGSTKFTQLDQYTNTLKTNMLTLATDPNIKKFFGPQMSNADVLLMTSAGTTLNPENLNSSQMKEELNRIDDLFTRMQSSLPAGMEIQGGQVVNTGQPQTRVYNGQTYVKVEGGWQLQ